MILPIAIGGAAIVGAAAWVCGRGVVVRSGENANGSSWRVRFACWRYFAEVKTATGNWSRVGTFSRDQMDAALALAKLLSNPTSFLSRRVGGEMVKIVAKKVEP